MLAVQASERSVTTIEGVVGAADELGDVQAALWEHGGLQCGYCTPGMVMTALDVVGRGAAVDDAAVRVEMSGNLCRCTGYDRIVEAVLSVVRSRSAAS
jgi:carbon-monoxide dehydrogenase small subunit